MSKSVQVLLRLDERIHRAVTKRIEELKAIEPWKKHSLNSFYNEAMFKATAMTVNRVSHEVYGVKPSKDKSKKKVMRYQGKQ